MSMRSSVLDSVEKDRKAREKARSLLAEVDVPDGGPITHDHMDAVYFRAPLRDRKAFFAHVTPLSLFITLAKHAAVQSAVMLADKEPPPLPEEPRALAALAATKLWKPVLKDVSVTTLARIYEQLAIDVRHGGDVADGGRYVRDSTKAAREANEIRHLGRDSQSLVGGLVARVDVAVHTAFTVIPYPALIINLASLTVEQADLIGTAAYRYYRRSQAEQQLSSPATTTRERVSAHKELATLDQQLARVDLPQELVLNLVRAGAGVLLEVVVGGFGTFLWPGWGTTIGQVLGGAAAWLAI